MASCLSDFSNLLMTLFNRQVWTSEQKVFIGLKLNSVEMWESKNYCVQLKAGCHEMVLGPISLMTIDSKITTIDALESFQQIFAASDLWYFTLLILYYGEAPARAPEKSLSSDAIYKKVCINQLKTLDDPTFSDFTFIINGTRFPVHKAILATASPVFYKVFTTNCSEKQNDVCKIDSFDSKAFEHLLRYLYGGEVPQNLSDMSISLYGLAYYYEIEDLREICKQSIQNHLSAKNALDAYKLAHLHNIEDLKHDAWKIIKR